MDFIIPVLATSKQIFILNLTRVLLNCTPDTVHEMGQRSRCRYMPKVKSNGVKLPFHVIYINIIKYMNIVANNLFLTGIEISVKNTFVSYFKACLL